MDDSTNSSVARRVYDAEQHADAARLDQREPCWVIWYGTWSRRFFAVPVWPSPDVLIVHAPSAPELRALMREAETGPLSASAVCRGLLELARHGG